MKKRLIALLSAFAVSLQLGAIVPAYADAAITAEMTVYNEHGDTVNSLNLMTDATVEIAISGEKNTQSQLYLAVYGADNCLLKVYKKNVTELPATEEFDLTLDGAAIQTPKAFLWDGMTPLTESVIGLTASAITSGEVQGILKAGNILSFVYEGINVTSDDITGYSWLQATSENGTYTEVGTDETFTATDDGTDYWYKVTATLENGSTYTTDAVSVAKTVKRCYSYPDHTWAPANALEYSNPDYTFEIEGQKFVLLDTVETSDKSHYLVIADQF